MVEELKKMGLYAEKAPNAAVIYIHRISDGQKLTTLHTDDLVRCSTMNETIRLVKSKVSSSGAPPSLKYKPTFTASDKPFDTETYKSLVGMPPSDPAADNICIGCE